MELKLAPSLAYDSQQQWAKPREGWVKVNFDAALFDDNSWGSIGAVVRHADGVVLAAMADHIENTLDVEAMEVMAALRGLNLAMEMGARFVELEGDTKGVVELFQASCPPLFDSGILFHEVLKIAESLSGFAALFVRRDFNYVAHTLTREVFRVGSRVWVDSLPISVAYFAYHDSEFY